jgi:hypothetical protein
MLKMIDIENDHTRKVCMEVTISRETVVKSKFTINLKELDLEQFVKMISSIGEIDLPKESIHTSRDLIEFLETTDQLSEIFGALQNTSLKGVIQDDDDFGDEGYFFQC